MIRQPSTDDISRLAEIHVYGWRFAYDGIVPREYLYKSYQVTKSMELHKNIVENNPEHSLVLDDGLIRGFVLHNPSRDEDLSDCYEVSALYIEPAFQGMGFGKTLVEAAEQIAREKGFSRNLIWVLEDNSKGRRFYEKYGYVQDGAEKMIDAWGIKELRYIKKL